MSTIEAKLQAVKAREIQNDPARALIVIDPRLSETATMADFHLAVRPGTDAWCLAALAAILVQDKLVARQWLAAHTTGYEQIAEPLRCIRVANCAEVCGADRDPIAGTPWHKHVPVQIERLNTPSEAA
jgi:anaerobic selenocysteine-containing dehydrogenase